MRVWTTSHLECVRVVTHDKRYVRITSTDRTVLKQGCGDIEGSLGALSGSGG